MGNPFASGMGQSQVGNVEALYAAGQLSPEEYAQWKAKLQLAQQPQLGELMTPTSQPETMPQNPAEDQMRVMDAAKLIFGMMQGNPGGR